MTIAIQGPHAAAYLADMGAEVVKVERPGGELNRYVHGPGFAPPGGVCGPQYVAMNRNKRGICLDVHSDVGRDVMHRLVRGADVFLTNYRREALERMGLGYAELAALNSRLVYARVSGFGDLGPDADKAMLDGAAQARGGLANISGPIDGPPMPPGAAIADHTGAMQLALGVMTALLARERTGCGQEVNTSALGAQMWVQAWELTHTTMSDEPLRREGKHNPNIRCPYGVYETKDGGAFMFVVAMSDESWDDFWLFVDRPDVLVDSRWNNVAKRIGARGSMDGVDEIRAAVAEAFAGRTTAEWTAFLATQPEIIYERIQDYTDVVADPQAAANGYIVDVDVPGHGVAGVVTNVVHLSKTPGGGIRRPPPLLGEHTAEVMTELGFGADEIEQVTASVAGFDQAILSAIFDD